MMEEEFRELDKKDCESSEDIVRAFTDKLDLDWKPQEGIQEPASRSDQPFPVDPDLRLPPPLSKHGFGILVLSDFPSQPRVIVCLECKCVIGGGNARSCKEHIRNHHKDSSDLVEVEHAPVQMDEDVEMAQVEEGELDQADQDSADGASEDVRMEPAVPHPAPQRRSYHSLNDWFDAQTEPIYNDLAHMHQPPHVIPVIPFFPVIKGFRCPEPDCTFGHMKQNNVEKHRRSHMQTQDSEYASIECKVQTLNSNDHKVPYFVVKLAEAEMTTMEEIKKQAMKDLAGYTRSSVPTDGLPYTNLFMHKFRFTSVFPSDSSSYTKLVSQYIVRSSIIHTSFQSPQEQLLALGTLFHCKDILKRIQGALFYYKRVLASKIP